MDIRVNDYLDDRLQSLADLESLDTLIESVKTQQHLLKQQLNQARQDHAAAEQDVEQHRHSVREKAQIFQKEQSDIDHKLLFTSQSETSDEAVKKFETSMERLQRLDVAVRYVELLKEVELLYSECTNQLGKSDDAALELYRRLQRLATTLQPLQDAAEGAAPHLLDHIVRKVHSLRDTIKKSFAEALEDTLKKISWPKHLEAIPLALETEWATNVGRLLDLQKTELEDIGRASVGRQPLADPPVLLPIEVLVQPLEQRFTYHFSGNKPTNRLDKPEYFLQHTQDLLYSYSNFLKNALQPLLLQHFRHSDLAFTPAYIDAISAFINALLPMLRRKLTSFAHQMEDQPQLLSHLIHEVIVFDSILIENYAFAPVTPSTTWRGLAYYLLDTCNYFPKWLAAERDFAMARYQSIVESPEAGELDYDSVGSDATKPTKMAVRVNDLLETITNRYRPLASFSEKLSFLIDVQIAIFDLFHKRLHQGLEAYLSMTSSVGRTVHGLSREEQAKLQGRDGLERLCRVFGSAEYLEHALRDWSDDVFFLELWQELQVRACNNEKASSINKLGGLQEIQQKTSTAVGGDDRDDAVQGALFDETAAAYRGLRIRSEQIIVDMLTHNVREVLRPYGRAATWASLSSASTEDSLSAELVPLMDLLKEYFEFLSKAVGRVPLRRFNKQICHAIQGYVWESVLIRHTFSTAGACQLYNDIKQVCVLIDRYLGAGQAQSGMRKLLEALKLISLPVRGEIHQVQPSRAGSIVNDEGSVLEETDGDRNDTRINTTPLALFEAEKMVFKDNQSAREMLQRLGLELVSESEARSLLQRRVEIGS
ncbi:hypothetical protein M433DRAFT_149929 [Acidomyces richmondensis BFW]|nr:MAG: hypothetical protein FE78DRAFT_93167 [Acidomyces sp. 'richmondensis']KYG49514.1 hypothetical protein M433DRAFT_149929 [Acidomyces richmondensis BFW]